MTQNNIEITKPNPDCMTGTTTSRFCYSHLKLIIDWFPNLFLYAKLWIQMLNIPSINRREILMFSLFCKRRQRLVWLW